MGIIKDKLHKI